VWEPRAELHREVGGWKNVSQFGQKWNHGVGQQQDWTLLESREFIDPSKDPVEPRTSATAGFCSQKLILLPRDNIIRDGLKLHVYVKYVEICA